MHVCITQVLNSASLHVDMHAAHPLLLSFSPHLLLSPSQWHDRQLQVPQERDIHRGPHQDAARLHVGIPKGENMICTRVTKLATQYRSIS